MVVFPEKLKPQASLTMPGSLNKKIEENILSSGGCKSAVNGICLSNKPEAQAKEYCVDGKRAFEKPSLALQACKDMQ